MRARPSSVDLDVEDRSDEWQPLTPSEMPAKDDESPRRIHRR